MTVVIKKSSGKERISKAWKQLEHKCKIDATKFCGVLNLDESPLVIQKKIRDVWE